jgi:hypothetical protein
VELVVVVKVGQGDELQEQLQVQHILEEAAVELEY